RVRGRHLAEVALGRIETPFAGEVGFGALRPGGRDETDQYGEYKVRHVASVSLHDCGVSAREKALDPRSADTDALPPFGVEGFGTDVQGAQGLIGCVPAADHLNEDSQ